jgi:hypothetical protein
VVVVTPEELERYRATLCLVECPAMKEGKTLYVAILWHSSATNGHGSCVPLCRFMREWEPSVYA